MVAYWLYGLMFLVVIVIYFIIKHYSPSTARSLKNFMIAWGFLIAIIVLYLLLRDKLGFFTADDWLGRRANTYLVIALLFFGISKFLPEMFRYHSPQIICRNDFHGSICGKPIETKNGFLIFSVDAIDWGLKLKYGNRTLVVRKETTCLNRKENYISITKPHKIDISKLPDGERQIIKRTFWLDENNIYYGWFKEIDYKTFEAKEIMKLKDFIRQKDFDFFGDFLDLREPSVSILLEMYMNLCSNYSNLQDQQDNLTKDRDKFEDHKIRSVKKWRRASKEDRPPPEGEL